MNKEIIIRLISKTDPNERIDDISVSKSFTDESIKKFLNDSLFQEVDYCLFIKDELFLYNIDFMMKKIGLSEEDIIEIEYQIVKETPKMNEHNFDDCISCIYEHFGYIFVAFYNGNIKKIVISAETFIENLKEWKSMTEVICFDSNDSKIVAFNKSNEILLIQNDDIKVLHQEKDRITSIAIDKNDLVYFSTRNGNIFCLNTCNGYLSELNIRILDVSQMKSKDNILYIITLEGDYILIDTVTHGVIYKNKEETSFTNFIVTNNDLGYLATTNSKIIKNSKFEDLKYIDVKLRMIEKMAIDEKRNLIAYTNGNEIKIINILNNGENYRIKERYDAVSGISWANNGSLYVSYENKMKIFTF